MRRGLIAWSKAEIPESVFDARLARLRAAMAAEKLDALVVYTNNTRTAGVSWLTAFVPYWAEGLLVVPLSGDPLLTMAFSNRIVGWGKDVSHVARFEGGARPGIAAGKYLADCGAKHVGVVEFDGLRAAVVEDMTGNADGVALADATALFENIRTKPGSAEIALITKAGIIGQRALSLATGTEKMIGEALASVDHEARLLGAEEVYMAAAPDLDRDPRFRRMEGTAETGRSFALRATLAYKGHWVRVTRTYFRDKADEALADRAAASFSAAVAGLPNTDGFKDFRSWNVEACRVTQPLDPIMGSQIDEPRALAPGSIANAQALITIDGRTIALAAPILVGREAFPSGFLVAPVFGRR
jgi:Xaa-Pro aminopeptidase